MLINYCMKWRWNWWTMVSIDLLCLGCSRCSICLTSISLWARERSFVAQCLEIRIEIHHKLHKNRRDLPLHKTLLSSHPLSRGLWTIFFCCCASVWLVTVRKVGYTCMESTIIIITTATSSSSSSSTTEKRNDFEYTYTHSHRVPFSKRHVLQGFIDHH